MVIDRWSFWKNFEDHLQVLTLKFGGRWSIANLMLKNGDRSLKFLEKFWRPFTSFDTQIWWSIANLMLKKSDRLLKFLEKFWKPFTSFDTQIWWSLIDRKFDVKKSWSIAEVYGKILKTIYKFWHTNSVIDRKFSVEK